MNDSPPQNTTRSKICGAIQRQIESFRVKFGREPGPDDPLFFDPEADTPQPFTQEMFDKSFDELLNAAAESGIPADLIYAMRKTRKIVTTAGYRLLSPKQRQEWDDAINEYHDLERRQRT